LLRILKVFIGVFCVVLGIAGLFLPVAPGLLFLIVGIELLGLGFLLPEKLRKENLRQAWRDFRRSMK